MRMGIATMLAIGLLSTMALGPWHSAIADDSSFTIDELEIDVVQMTNETAFLVIERVYFNNTGDSEFSGTLRYWLSETSELFSMACENRTSSTVMRRVDGSGYKCYNFTRETSDQNVISFAPFEEDESLSYFGQEANLILNASSDNGSAWHSVPLNITVGAGNESRSITSSGQGLSVNATLEGLDARQTIASSTRIIASQWMNVTNESPWNVTGTLSIQALPAGWVAHFFNETSENDTFDLLPNETRAFKLEVELPPHRLFMEFFHVLFLDVTGDQAKSITFEQRFLHNVTLYDLWLFCKSGSTVTLPIDYLHTVRPAGEYVFPGFLHSIYFFDEAWDPYKADLHEILGFPDEGEALQMSIEWEEESSSEAPLGVMIVLVVVLAAAIAFVVLRKRSKDEETEVPEEPAEPKASPDRAAEIAESLKEAKAAFAAGHLSGTFYEDLSSRYEKELAEIETQEDSGTAALKAEKERLLEAIRSLQKRRDEGKISENTYQNLVKDYKKKAIEIMKEIDEKGL